MDNRFERGLKALTSFALWFLEVFKVIGLSMWANTFPWKHVIGCFWAIAIFLIFEIDVWLVEHFNMGFLYPYHPVLYRVYALTFLYLPFLGWGTIALRRKRAMKTRLDQAFVNADLKTRLGKIPKVLSDRPIDEHSRKIVLRSSGLPLKNFEDARETLEAELQIFIDEIKGDHPNGLIEILYAFTPMPDFVEYPVDFKFPGFSFPVGLSRSKLITGSLKESPHLLVAGSTGGGKSSFIRSLITSIYRNHKGVEFTMVDLKNGMELGFFEGLERVRFASSIEDTVPLLEGVEELLESRGQYLRAVGCEDLDQFYKKMNKEGSDLPKPPDSMRRQIVIVDEAADVFLAGQTTSASQSAQCKRILSAIARKGRALGINLVLGTQRPDVKSLDPQIKANLTSVLCFLMKNNASSMTVLDSGRAAQLPEIPGRGIWKKGRQMIELQTPYLTTGDIESLLGKYKKSVPKKEIKVNSQDQTSSEARAPQNSESESSKKVAPEIGVIDGE